jgi:hypothetical protein
MQARNEEVADSSGMFGRKIPECPFWQFGFIPVPMVP